MTEKTGLYTKKVFQHFQNPKNMGRLKNPDGIGKVGNPTCGDVMWLYIKIGKDKKGREIIKDIKFETFGCVAAIATSSVVTDLAKGKTVEQALKISKAQVVKSLGGLPPIKLHCSVLAADALLEAVYDYFRRQKRIIPKELEESHQRIQGSRERIEERYSEWTKLEEKIRKAKN
jgi:nitrogen fixation NifU-like protein